MRVQKKKKEKKDGGVDMEGGTPGEHRRQARNETIPHVRAGKKEKKEAGG